MSTANSGRFLYGLGTEADGQQLAMRALKLLSSSYVRFQNGCIISHQGSQ